MGKAPENGAVGGGRAWGIATGGMLPEGADAVVMVEYTNEMPDGTLEVRRPVAPGENGSCIPERRPCPGRSPFPLPAGACARKISVCWRPWGQAQVRVYQKPRVAVLSSGDEIVPITQTPPPGTVRDANAFLVAAQVTERGWPPPK